MSKRPPKRPERERSALVVPPVPPRADRSRGGSVSHPRERWDLFNLGVAAYTLPLNTGRMFADAREREINPVGTELAGTVFLEAHSVRESARRLAPGPGAERDFQCAVDRLLVGPPVGDGSGVWGRTRSAFVTATAPVVGFANPRLPWFTLGTCIGRWRALVVDHLDALLTESARRLALQKPPPGDRPDLVRSYAPHPFAPIFLAATHLDPEDASDITPVRRLVAGWHQTRNEVQLRAIVREYADTRHYDAVAWELDLQAVNGLEVAFFCALESARGNPSRPTWNRAERSLRYQGRVVRRYAAQAAAVIAVFDRFEHEQWPTAVRAPDPVLETLHDTVRSLNKDLPELRFSASGENITWRALPV